MLKPLQLVPVALILILPLGAQGTQGGRASLGTTAGTAPIADPCERLVGIPVGADVNGLALLSGALLLDTFGPGNQALNQGGIGQVARLYWTDAASARAGSILLMQAGVLFTELNFSAGPSESIGCGSTGAVSAEQCTAAFYDGTPTQGEYDDQSMLATIAIEELPPPLPGRQTIVAVIDTGIDPTHPLFVGGIAGPGYDFITNSIGGYDIPNGLDDDRDGVIDEAYGHGTHVSGIIRVVDPSALLLPYRVLNSEGNGTAFDVARAIYQAEIDGAQIINLSLGLARVSLAVEGALEGVTENGLVVIASAGNTGQVGIGALAANDETIAVAAVDDQGVLAPFATYGSEVDVVAPGVGIYSAMPGGQYAWWSGSSMSTAVVSGAVSRLRASTLDANQEEAEDALGDGGIEVDDLNPGKDGLLGEGIIHLGLALQELLEDS